MRRNYISPEFESSEAYGTYNMVEESNFFGAKMLEIEDGIYVYDQNIIYNQKIGGEQLDFSVESSLPSVIYSAASDKNQNHRLYLNESQTEYQKENGTIWNLDINIGAILSSYIFAELKRWRTFEGLRKEMTSYNDVNIAIRKYIEFNVINRYKTSRIDLFIRYKDIRGQSLLKYSNKWNPDSVTEQNRMTKFQSEDSIDGMYSKLMFPQQNPGSTYVFDYFFNILFEKT
jgi:hypothetical protein